MKSRMILAALLLAVSSRAATSKVRKKALTPATPSVKACSVTKAEQAEVTAQCSFLPRLKIPLHSSGGVPHFVDVHLAPHKEKERPLYLLIYDSGTAGTRAQYRMIRALVVDLQQHKILGEAPWGYESIDGAARLIQPAWLWEEQRLEVKDEEFGENLTLMLLGEFFDELANVFEHFARFLFEAER